MSTLVKGENREPLSIVERIATGMALTAQELAAILSVSDKTIFRLARKCVLPSFRIGTSLRFCPATVSAWLKKVSITGAPCYWRVPC
jgi:excisionase family DNA binding protein